MTVTEEIPMAPEWKLFQDAVAAGIDRGILCGPPGTGKSFGATNMLLKNIHVPTKRVVCNEDMTAADITGCFMPGPNGQFVWHNGAVLDAWITGARVVADEIDRASGDVLSLLLAMFDSPESASWTHPITGQIHRPHPDFSVWMTTNVENMEDLPTALADRFPVVIRIAHPHPDALARLSPDLRQAAYHSCDKRGSNRISMRKWLSFDGVRKSLGDDRAAELIFGDKAEDILTAIRVDSVSA